VSKKIEDLLIKLEKSYSVGEGVELTWDEIDTLVKNLISDFDTNIFNFKKRHYKRIKMR